MYVGQLLRRTRGGKCGARRSIPTSEGEHWRLATLPWASPWQETLLVLDARASSPAEKQTEREEKTTTEGPHTRLPAHTPQKNDRVPHRLLDRLRNGDSVTPEAVVARVLDAGGQCIRKN